MPTNDAHTTEIAGAVAIMISLIIRSLSLAAGMAVAILLVVALLAI
jgi:hypothetical protein